jgi:hypothetical protein
MDMAALPRAAMRASTRRQALAAATAFAACNRWAPAAQLPGLRIPVLACHRFATEPRDSITTSLRTIEAQLRKIESLA